MKHTWIAKHVPDEGLYVEGSAGWLAPRYCPSSGYLPFVNQWQDLFTLSLLQGFYMSQGLIVALRHQKQKANPPEKQNPFLMRDYMWKGLQDGLLHDVAS